MDLTRLRTTHYWQHSADSAQYAIALSKVSAELLLTMTTRAAQEGGRVVSAFVGFSVTRAIQRSAYLQRILISWPQRSNT